MKYLIVFALFLSTSIVFSQTANPVENIIIVTMDGLRWQEVFNGIDSVITEMPKFNQNKKEQLYKKYGAITPQDSRKKLLPFIWSTVAEKGQLYGNRNFGNAIDNSNPYWFSFPCYSEIFCGFVDTAINSNGHIDNPNTNVLEYINKQPGFTKKIAAFGAWDAFDRILNEQRSGFPVTCGGETYNNNDATQKLLGEMKRNSYTPFGTSEYLDVFTHYQAFECLKKEQPRVLYIAYGETDEWAHKGNYHDYLNAAHQVDEWLNELWNFIQTTPNYKNKTALLITVDHGRGDVNKSEWTGHGSEIVGSQQIWFAVISPSIEAKGEMKTTVQLYQKQYAQTFAKLLGLKFTCEHPVASEIVEIFEKNN